MSVFTVRATANDVEAVMGAMGDALREWEGGSGLPLDLAIAQTQNERLTDKARLLNLQWNLDGNAVVHSNRPRIGPWIIRFQLIVRRLTWWFLEPILLQIRMFQMNTAQVVGGLAQNQEVMLARLTADPRAEWENRLQTLEAQIYALQHQRAEAEDRNATRAD